MVDEGVKDKRVILEETEFASVSPAITPEFESMLFPQV